MTPSGDQNLSSAAEAEKTPRHRRLGWLAVLAVLLVLAAAAAGWTFRKSVAGQALANWCLERDLACSGRFEQLSSDGATVSGLTVSGGGQLAFEAQKARVQLAWPGLFSPQVSGIEVEAPTVYGTLSDGQLTFHGLEKLIPTGGSGSSKTTLPAIDIRDGRILIETGAGEVSAKLTVSGKYPQEGHLSLTLDPARLAEPQGRVRWSGGVVEMGLEDGRLTGEASLRLEEAATDDVSLADATLTATMDAGLSDGDPLHLVWESRIGQASAAGYALHDVSSSGHVGFSDPEEWSPAAVLRSVTGADVQVETGALAGADYSTETLRLEASLEGDNGRLSGPVDIALKKPSAPQGNAREVAVAGQAGWSAEAGASFSGQVSGKGVGLSDSTIQPLTARISLPTPLTAHGQSLQVVLRKSLADFDVGISLDMQAGEGAFRLTGKEEASLQAASGLSLSVTPAEGRPWLETDGQQVKVSGDVSLKGGRAPRFRTSVEEFFLGADELRVEAQQSHLSPWTVDGAGISADIPAFALSNASGAFSLQTNGTVTLSGRVSGLDLSDTSLSGGIQAVRSDAGWQVEPEGSRCLSLSTKGVGVGDVQFEAMALPLCPAQSGFVQAGSGAASGSVQLGNVSWPFRSKSVTGVLNYSQAVADWSARKGFVFTVSAPLLDLPLEIEDRSLSISGEKPRIGLSTAKGQVPHLSATLDETVLGGTLIPAKVSAGQVAFDGQIGTGGLSGDIVGNEVMIRDFRDDPIYQPIVAELFARLEDGRLTLSGPLRLQANSARIGDISADVNLLTLSGTARVATRELEFRKGGLQPVMLSERLRGVYTDAAGAMEAASDVVITDGKLSGTADVSVSDFGFQTTRLGRVRNVNGEVHFADLFSLTTAPSQVLTIGSMDPGVPLADGRIVFGFTEGSVLAVESASFPFSGGTLALSPFNWTLGAETQHVEVTADAIDLTELVRTLELPKIEAEGTVSGRFPIDVERSKILIRDAQLFADAGGGHLAYVGNAADSAAKSDANVRLAFEALKDFDFTVLEVGLDGNIADRVTITLKLAGKSRNDIAYGENASIVRGQPFEFDISIDSALADLFRSSQFYTNQQLITDFVVQEVLTDKGLTPAKDE